MTENEAKDVLDRFWEFAICREEERVDILKNIIEAANIAIQALEEKQQYESIGTVEEFKALKEKNEPKRLLTREEKYPQNYGIYSTSDRWCPCCKGLVFTSDWSVYKQNIMYKRTRCGCGQKLDW